MNLYPCLQFEMGLWKYYVVKMTSRELAEQVKFASEVYEDRTLDDAIQRILNTGRVKKEIVTYLQKQPWRFFSSIVVAAIRGNPQFYPVELAEDPRFQVLANDDRLNRSFGVLAFDGTQDYYALDGQHRLAAIRTALDRNDPIASNTPEDFKDDEFSVIIVVPNMDDTDETFLEKYRRLFSNLNRYAKPMDNATNIIMDEDDPFAIITRRLISDHEFFRWEGRQREHPTIKTSRGKNLKSGSQYFTTIEVLYDMNISLLNSRWRENEKWDTGAELVDLNTFKRFRPDEEVIDQLYTELIMYWDSLLDELPILRQDPRLMRTHEVADDGASDDEDLRDHSDHLLFWPIGQMMLADLVRETLDRRLPDPKEPTRKDVATALHGLASLQWSLNAPPWIRFLLIHEDTRDGRGRWKMRSEERKRCVRIGQRIQQWLLGVDELDKHDVQDLHTQWVSRLIPFETDWAESAWNTIKHQRVTT